MWLCSHGQLDAKYGELSVAALNAAVTNSAAAPHESEDPRSILQSRLSIHRCQEKNYLSTGRCRYFKSLSNYIMLAGAARARVCVHARHAGWLSRLKRRTLSAGDIIKSSKMFAVSKNSWGDEKQGEEGVRICLVDGKS